MPMRDVCTVELKFLVIILTHESCVHCKIEIDSLLKIGSTV